jgi:hypothetical protein
VIFVEPGENLWLTSQNITTIVKEPWLRVASYTGGSWLSLGDMPQTSNEMHVGILMVEFREKYTIRVTDRGLVITGKEDKSLEFSAVEALMLLDVLKGEEAELRKIAEEASPISLRIGG